MEQELSPEKKLEAAEVEATLENLLAIKLDSSSSKEAILDEIRKGLPGRCIVTRDHEIWISDRDHSELMRINDLWPDQNMIGWFGYYERRGELTLDFYHSVYAGMANYSTKVFADLYKRSSLSEEKFEQITREVIKQKIIAFLGLPSTPDQ